MRGVPDSTPLIYYHTSWYKLHRKQRSDRDYLIYQWSSKIRIASNIGSSGPERVEDCQGFLENILRIDPQFLQQGWLVGELVVAVVLLTDGSVRCNSVQRGRLQVGWVIVSSSIVSIKTWSVRIVESLLLTLVPATHLGLGFGFWDSPNAQIFQILNGQIGQKFNLHVLMMTTTDQGFYTTSASVETKVNLLTNNYYFDNNKTGFDAFFNSIFNFWLKSGNGFPQCRTGTGKSRTWGLLRLKPKRKGRSILQQKQDTEEKVSGKKCRFRLATLIQTTVYFISNCSWPDRLILIIYDKFVIMKMMSKSIFSFSMSYPDFLRWAKLWTWATTQWQLGPSTTIGSTCFIPFRISQNLWVHNIVQN